MPPYSLHLSTIMQKGGTFSEVRDYIFKFRPKGIILHKDEQYQTYNELVWQVNDFINA